MLWALLILSLLPIGNCENSTNSTENSTTINCVLPPPPKFGRYKVNTIVQAETEIQPYTSKMAVLNITCDPGYEPYSVSGQNWKLKASIVWTFCSDGGILEGVFPKCVRVCQLKPHPSVAYKCLQPGGIHGLRDCETTEPTGTVVKPVCNSHYYTPEARPYMHCANGKWNYKALCTPECGTVTAPGYIGDGAVQQGELPWHANIYSIKDSYKRLCSGSLISSYLVLSAAHPFWDHNKLFKADNFAVGLGTIHNQWSYEGAAEKGSKFNVTRIIVPKRFRAMVTNFEDNIAVLVLSRAVEFNKYVKPVCLDYDITFENWQLSPGKEGKVATWGFVTEFSGDAMTLMTVKMTHVRMEQCLKETVPNARKYFTSDKMCADAELHEPSFCNGDVGAGLVFPNEDISADQPRYYLRGIVALPPSISCRQLPHEPFTLISKHKGFLKRIIRKFPNFDDSI